ncbi:hypothetical protein AB0B94_26125 [Micromonospora sp. NPDC048986]|uniref:hypothetical protein n=1 Tax=Micromonospora sp. NPDC048986 TaxID=3155644 RepID=UPI0033C9FF68
MTERPRLDTERIMTDVFGAAEDVSQQGALVKRLLAGYRTPHPSLTCANVEPQERVGAVE